MKDIWSPSDEPYRFCCSRRDPVPASHLMTPQLCITCNLIHPCCWQKFPRIDFHPKMRLHLQNFHNPPKVLMRFLYPGHQKDSRVMELCEINSNCPKEGKFSLFTGVGGIFQHLMTHSMNHRHFSHICSTRIFSAKKKKQFPS